MIWDLVIVTARTAQQRWLFERYLARLWPTAAAGGQPQWRVLQDPPGPQLGTAGATLHALAAAAQQLGTRLRGTRVLVLHCGGLSQRVPQLAHVGKCFAPGAGAGETTLFAEVVAELDRLLAGMEPGAVVACGDVYYRGAAVGSACRRGEALAVAHPASAEQSSRHGVYLWNPGEDRVACAWQKPPVERLLALPPGQPWGLDTGILYLGADVVERLLGALGPAAGTDPLGAFLRRKAEWRGVELYRDLTLPMTLAWEREARLPGAPGEAQEALASFSLRVACPEDAELLHFGTNAELMRILAGGGLARIFASYVPAGEVAPGSVLDRCLSERPVVVGAGSYLSGLNRPAGAVRVGARRVAYQMPLRSRGCPAREVFVAFGVQDDVRRHPRDGATLVGEPLEAWLRELGVSAEEAWEGVPERERCLWNARLFPVGPPEAVAEAVAWLQAEGGTAAVDRWRRSPRTSMAEANRLFDARRWWAHEERIQAHRFAATLEAAVLRGDSETVGRLLADPALPAGARRLAQRRLAALGEAEACSLTGARAWLVVSSLAPASARPAFRSRGFEALSRTLVRDAADPAANLEWAIEPGEAIAARAPVRVDLAGGWTDTPPQACERGGVVLNLALLLEGRRPVSARVERLRDPVVELAAEDLGVRIALEASPPPGRPDPRNPFAIHLAALRLVGLLGGGELRDRLLRLGGGLRLVTDAAVPKGSGLGTSSILGAAVLAVLEQAFGRALPAEELCLRVLQLEQLMGTGGGWQDQVGGIWPGAKLAASRPGLAQRPDVRILRLTPERERELTERAILFYTGEPRLARDILQRVVGRYLTGDPDTMAALEEMPDLARRAAAALEAGDWDALGACLDRSWALNCRLEPTCTNESLDALFRQIRPYVFGAKLAGAGGGGFLFALARDAAARAALEARLREVPPPARLFAATLDPEGLRLEREAMRRTG